MTRVRSGLPRWGRLWSKRRDARGPGVYIPATVLTVLALLALSEVAAGIIAVVSANPSASREETMQCDAGKAQWAVGKTPDDDLVERARRDAGARVVRVITYGMMVTMEYDAARLSLDLDAHGRVGQVRCG